MIRAKARKSMASLLLLKRRRSGDGWTLKWGQGGVDAERLKVHGAAMDGGMAWVAVGTCFGGEGGFGRGGFEILGFVDCGEAGKWGFNFARTP